MYNILTINTDAGFCPKTKIATYAIYARHDDFFIQSAGVFKTHTKDSHHAERKAILNALHLVSKKNSKISKVIINTDSRNSIELLSLNKNKLGNKQKELYEFLKLFLEYKKKLSCKIEFRHVKSHQKVETAKQYANNWCDKTCKSILIEERVKQGFKSNGDNLDNN